MCSFFSFCFDLMTLFRSVSINSLMRYMSPSTSPSFGMYTTSFKPSMFSCCRCFIILISLRTRFASIYPYHQSCPASLWPPSPYLGCQQHLSQHHRCPCL
ncbi:hypothetical protein FGO68_gene17026 [Halteria grandinella]|uniref:Uncharacterized protein n=1 Tax=Halteria grandinella TaxID=5974 RepID=A0A8J8T2E4_HALGN|nr:hypothetical protein FGO68_gene17026 [Halteria grandinella]